MVDRHKLTLGKTLGEGEHYITVVGISELYCLDSGSDQIKACLCAGEFGSVMEGLLTQEDSVLKVAVKTMKSESKETAASLKTRAIISIRLTSSSCCVLVSCYLHSHRDGRFPERSSVHEGVRSSECHAASR